jgi:diguanylate cyclase (GGDEF)-like protein/PAS domain S-box-containing protein
VSSVGLDPPSSPETEAANLGARLSRVLAAADEASMAVAAETCLEELAAYAGVDRAFVAIFDEHERVVARFGWDGSGSGDRTAPLGARLEEVAGSSTGFMRIGRSVAIGNLAAIELTVAERQAAERAGGLPAAAMLVPVLVGQDIAGLVGLHSTAETRTWPRPVLAEMEAFAELLVKILGRSQQRHALAAANARARRIAAHLPDGLLMLTTDGAISWVSPSFSAAWGRSAETLERSYLADLVAPSDRPELEECLGSLEPGVDEQLPLRLADRHGRWRWADLSVSLAHEPGVPDEIVVTVRDTHDRHLREMRLLAESDRDPLTGLANRGAFDRFVGELASGSSSVLVAFCDIDGFKGFNDARGHDVGDDVLKAVARAIAGAVRSGDMVARIGGDEFVVVVVDPGHDAAVLGDRIVQAVRAIPDSDRRCSVSVGVCGPAPGAEARTMIRRADEAMYAAKRAGKDGWVRAEALGP